ncbi:MAG TPA: hypothetical protein VMA73_27820 [Streptosporangiaceae bacterium]|nr:hypothetical protein [Streptosporangiaceae bacterium]
MTVPISARDYDFGWIGKGNTAVLTLILLDAYGVEAAIVSLLPLIHAVIQTAHRSVLEVNEIALIHV